MHRGRSICGARVRRSVESATASAEAADEAQRSALLSSLAEVARDYIQLRGVQAQLQIARDNVRTARQSLNLTQQRAAGGVTTDLDVANASAQLRTTLAQIPSLEQQEAQLINALSLLLGQPPNALRTELQTAKPVPPVPPRVPVGSAFGTGAPPARYPSGGGAAACRDRRYRRGAGEFLSVAQADRQFRTAVAAVRPRVRPELEAVCGRARADDPDLPGRPVALDAATARRRSSRRQRSISRRPCCRPGTMWTTH